MWTKLQLLYDHIINMFIYTCIYMQNGSQWHNDKGRAKTSSKKYTSRFIVTFVCERELETEQNCNILTPTLMAVSAVSFSFSRAAQPEARGLSFLLSAGFPYHIFSATSLDPNSIGGSKGPFGLVWPSLPHLVYNSNWSLTCLDWVIY